MSYSDILSPLRQLESDIHKCAATLQTYRMLWSSRNSQDHVGMLVEAQIEYLVSLLRSMYDVLQQVVSRVGARLIALDNRKRITKNIPQSYADVALHGDHFRTPQEIQRRWGIPLPLGEWYGHEAPFFVLPQPNSSPLRERLGHGRFRRIEDGSVITRDKSPSGDQTWAAARR